MRLANTFAVIVAVALLGFISCDQPKSDKEPVSKQKKTSGPKFKKEGVLHLVKVSGDTIRTIDLEIAHKEHERTQGLMHRRRMKDTQGMLFIFDNESIRSFWMKNTLMGLDIIYIKADGEIESIAKYVIPKSERPVPSAGPAMYVLEVVEGFCDLYQVEVGDRIEWTGEDQL
jgi:hypothetical protein